MKLYLITGFLGAGKTTFLKKLIDAYKDRRLHLVINEFGREGVDGAILSGLGAAINEINNGSIFCSCRIDKFEEVLASLEDSPAELVFVESSGLSDPTNVRAVLGGGRFPKIEYGGCVAIVDAARFDKVYDTAVVVKKQIAVADMVLINKTDIAGSEKTAAVRGIVASHRPDVPIYETTFGSFEKEWIDGLDPSRPPFDADRLQTKDITLRKYAVTVRDGFSKGSLERFVRQFMTESYRVKGYVKVSDGGVMLLDCVGGIYALEETAGCGDALLNKIVVLSGEKLQTKRAIKKAAEMWPDLVEGIE